MTTYQAYATSLAPVWLQGGSWPEEIAARAAPLDELVLRTRTLLLARLIATAPEDALQLIGQERGLRRYPGEPADTYRRRVRGAWTYWRLAGTLPGLTRALADAGYQAMITEHIHDPDPAHWAEFSVAVSPLHPLPTRSYWDAQTAWGQVGASWGIDPNAVPTQWLPDLIREVKPAHARLRTLTYYPRGRFWGSAAQWGEGRDPTPPAQPGWGVWTGYQTVTPAGDRTDSGAAWGESDAEIIYQLED